MIKNNKIFLFLFVVIGLLVIIPANFTITDSAYENTHTFLQVSQDQEYVWNKTWGAEFLNDEGAGIALDSDGNVYVTGFTESVGLLDMVLVKYDSDGEEQWFETWGGSEVDFGYGIAIDNVNNIYVSGTTASFDLGNGDIFWAKYNNAGVQQWNNTWGDTDIDGASRIATDTLGNVYVTGFTMSFGAGGNDLVIIKFNGANGVIEWNYTWGGGGFDVGYDVVVDSLNNVYVGGVTKFGAGGNDAVLVKYNSAGIQQWNHTWGGAQYDECYGLALDSSDNIYMTGYTMSSGAGSEDCCIVKYDSTGTELWSHTWGGTSIDIGYAVYVDSSDNVYVTGKSLSFGALSYDIFLTKYSSTGVSQWNKSWGTAGVDSARDIVIDDTDSIFIGGFTDPEGTGDADLVLLKYLLDLDDPIVIISSPSSGSRWGITPPDYDISITEQNLKSAWYTVDAILTTYPVPIPQLSGTINQGAWEAAPYGTINITFYAEDLLGHIGSDSVNIEKIEPSEPTIVGYHIVILVGMIGTIGVITTYSVKRKLK